MFRNCFQKLLKFVKWLEINLLKRVGLTRIIDPIKELRNSRKLGHQIELRHWDQLTLSRNISSFAHIGADPQFDSLAWTLFEDQRVCMSIREIWNLYNWVKRTKGVPGNIAEVGVFSGGSAKLICEVEQERKVELFDTFEGLPETNAVSDGDLKKGDIRGGSLQDVQMFLSGYKNINFYPGFFPSSAENINLTKACYSLVHLDVDIYSTTKHGLEYFYPRLSKGGAILTHDYRCTHTPGVRQAFEEFFLDKPESVIELWDTQAVVIKL